MKAAARLFLLALALAVAAPAWSIPTDNYVVTSPGARRAFAVRWVPGVGDDSIYNYGGGRINNEYAMRYVLPDPVTVHGRPTTVVRDAPQGYAEYWQFGGGALLLRIDEGDYNDQYGIGVLNRQNLYSPAIPVLPQDAVVGSTLRTSGEVLRFYNNLVYLQQLDFDSTSQVIGVETIQLDGVSRQAFRVQTTIHHSGLLIDTPNVDYTVTLTNLFVQGIGLVPVRTTLQWQTPTDSSPTHTLLEYTPITPDGFSAAAATFAPRTAIPPGVAVDFHGASPNLGSAIPEVSVSHGQFAGQEHPPSSFHILEGIWTVRTRAPTTAKATNCGSLVLGQSDPANFCVTTWDTAGQPQTGVVVLSEWGDFVGASGADYFATIFSARRGSYWLEGVLNDKVYNMTFDGGSKRGWVNFLIAMPDNDWPRRGRFNGLLRERASVGMTGQGCNQSISDVLIHDVQYDANQNIASFAADVEQHCENHPEALFISLRYNSRVPFNAFASPTLGSPYLLKHDFNGDFRSDVLWRNGATGETYIYPMDGRQILPGEGYVRTVADSRWNIVGLGDFDGDGKADILWRNSATGDNYIYFMDGTSIKPTEGYMRAVGDQNWQVVGIGDFDGDGKADILWRNSVTGENYIFFMDGKLIRAEGSIRTVADQNWKIAGIGDFDGDGKSDILWRNSTTGENYLYPMNQIAVKPTEGYLRTVADLNWKIAGIGDFDGDGKADIAWRNSSTGENYVYPMDGSAIKPSEGYLRTVADVNWQIVAVADYDGDGKSDLLWRNSSTGENYLYPMDGMTIRSTEGFLRAVPTSWSVVSP